MKWVEYGAQAQEPPGKPTAPVIPPARQNTVSSVPLAQPSQVELGGLGEGEEFTHLVALGGTEGRGRVEAISPIIF